VPGTPAGRQLCTREPQGGCGHLWHQSRYRKSSEPLCVGARSRPICLRSYCSPMASQDLHHDHSVRWSHSAALARRDVVRCKRGAEQRDGTQSENVERLVVVEPAYVVMITVESILSVSRERGAQAAVPVVGQLAEGRRSTSLRAIAFAVTRALCPGRWPPSSAPPGTAAATSPCTCLRVP
jgi:hypothetical protein